MTLNENKRQANSIALQQVKQSPDALLPELAWLRDLVIAAVVGSAIGAAILLSPYVALLLIVGLVAAYVMLLRPMLVLYLLIVATALTSGMPRGSLVPLIIPNEAVLLFAFGIAVLTFLAALRRREIDGWVAFAVVLLIVGKSVAPVTSFYVRGWPLSIADITNFLASFQYVLLLWMFVHVPENAAQRVRVLQLMFAMASIVAIFGLLQALQLPWVNAFLNTWYPSGQVEAAAEVGRITSIVGAWNVLGTFMMFNLLLLSAFQTRAQPNRIYRWNARVSGLLSLFCLLATGSFASILGLLVGYVLIKYFEPKGLSTIVPFLLASVLAMLLLAPLISTRLAYQFEDSDGTLLPHTLAERFDIWTGIYLPLIEQQPIWGVRPNTEGLSWAYAESEYINLLFHSGVISLVAHMLWVGILLQWLYKVIRGSRAMSHYLAVALFAVLITLSLMAFTNAVFTYSITIDYLWILLGLTINAREDELYEKT